MNLVVEIGNSNAKLAIFDGKDMVQFWSGPDEEDLRKQLHGLKIQKAILSGSGNINIDWWQEILAEKKLVFNANLLPHIRFEYTTPQSLGADRLINAWYAHRLFSEKDNLVIDTGTCITFTLINSQSTIIGGSISPGLALRAASLHDYTDKLPLIEIDYNQEAKLIGKNTQASISSGIILGTLFEMEKRIEQYLTQFPNLNIIMTGGGTQFFENKLNYRIFADRHFTLEGLNALLLDNE
jgi:type III pantothenate kinase